MIVDLFAGPGGWSEGLRLLGLTDIGIEWDAAACATRTAAGHLTVRADVATYPPERFTGAEGLIASPPCPDWSTAGKRAGRAGTSGHLIDLVPRWVDATRPRWVACEQVPPALDVWHEHAALYRTWGYSTWAGILNAANFGVPQTRRRAILLARLDGPALPPEPTHCQGGSPTLFSSLAPWVSMADALGWDGLELHRIRGAGMTERHGPRPGRPMSEPAFTIEGGSWRRMRLTERQAHGTTRSVDEPTITITASADNGNFRWPWRSPATTIAGDPRITARCHHDEGSQGANAKTTDQVQAGDYEGTEQIRLTLAQALTLQSFPPGYPVQGTKTAQFRQVGDAVPPLLAAHVVAAATGRVLDLPAPEALEAAG